MIVALIIILCFALAAGGYSYHQHTQLKQFKEKHGTIEELEKKLLHLQCSLADSERFCRGALDTIEMLKQEKTTLNTEVAVLKTEREAAQEALQEQANVAAQLAEKELALAREKRLAEFNKQLEAELIEIRLGADVTKYQEELKKVNEEIEDARLKLKVWQEQALNAAKEEDFINYHSIELSPQDLKDIELIRSFAPQLTRQEAFHKIIWTEYIQKPIQQLCKTLEVEKVMGIYKITHIETGRMYIGQAVDIAARWKEHCKCALGIGSTSYQSNKFYKAMHDKGIENFTFEILETCARDKLNEREFYWIDVNNATTFGFNSKAGG